MLLFSSILVVWLIKIWFSLFCFIVGACKSLRQTKDIAFLQINVREVRALRTRPIIMTINKYNVITWIPNEWGAYNIILPIETSSKSINLPRNCMFAAFAANECECMRVKEWQQQIFKAKQ